ncbi:hypothetical protein LCGC14_2753390 [marine sediment metagenome]|uniref:KOW domain-containing protein n=1 Tax=marine sediment metagenome TaxID=412755 RepID=A0A0F8Z128_9ZZZZ
MQIGDKVKVIKDEYKGQEGVLVDIERFPEEKKGEGKDEQDLYLVDLPNSKHRGGFFDWMKKRMDNKGKDVTIKTAYFNREDLELCQ